MDWKGRIAYLATLHRKEEVIAPLLAEHLGIQVQVIPLDTDQFGTFSRERPRPGDPLHTLRLKIERARQAYPAPLVLASEGSFGPHPQIPWMPWNQEWVMLKVFESGADPLELVGYAESTQTNFSHCWVQSFAEALDFAQKVGFPEHALIALDQPENPQVIHNRDPRRSNPEAGGGGAAGPAAGAAPGNRHAGPVQPNPPAGHRGSHPKPHCQSPKPLPSLRHSRLLAHPPPGRLALRPVWCSHPCNQGMDLWLCPLFPHPHRACGRDLGGSGSVPLLQPLASRRPLQLPQWIPGRGLSSSP
jgi:hypothetical protein